jgi:hypothetical protein
MDESIKCGNIQRGWYSSIQRTKSGAGGMVKVVEPLASKHRAISSNSSTAKNNNKEVFHL